MDGQSIGDTSNDFLSTERRKTESNAIEIPSITLPKGGGAIRGIDEKFSVNAVNGTSTFSIPLPVAPARGVTPSLALSYNSGFGNGVFGLGWDVQLGVIQRKTDKGLPTYRDATDMDTFLFADAEDLVPEFAKNEAGSFIKDENDQYIWNERDSTDGLFTIRLYKPRIEGLFARIERWTEKTTGLIKWRVITKDNLTTLLGWTANGVIANPEDPTKIFKWLPEFTFDDKGNCSHYVYVKENETGFDRSQVHNKNRYSNGSITYTNTYLDKIVYGNKTPYVGFGNPFPAEGDYMFQTVFDYGTLLEGDNAEQLQEWDFRADAFSNYKPGFELRTTRLCKRILLFHVFEELAVRPDRSDAKTLVKSVNLGYDTGTEQDFTFLTSITSYGYIKREDGTYSNKKLPPLEFEYQKHDWSKEVKTIKAADAMHAPVGLDDQQYQFTDLFNEGLSGILTEQTTGWYYKHNLGEGRFEAATLVSPKPSFSGLGDPLSLLDIDADGGKQLVSFTVEPKGYFELGSYTDWEGLKTFKKLPNIDFKDPNTRMLDINGDGKPEILICNDDVFTWYESKGRDGFAQGIFTTKSKDEEKGPHIIFNERHQSIYLADMTGDGMTDIVRIKQCEVCYWPNLGYGKFGAKITMGHAPKLDGPDMFNPAYVKLADIDGSGTSDIIYLGKNKCTCWKNLSGNSFSTIPFEIDSFPEIHPQSRVTVTDLLGNGVACIVWSSRLSKDANASLKYIDLMNSKKPHMMVFYKNNMGKEITMEYTPSTKFYIADKLAGRPWATKLHFPVQCISKISTKDKITGHQLVTSYTYHHGYYDYAEREFRGFGMVEKTDTETFEHWKKGTASNIVEEPLHQEPIITKTWNHIGAFIQDSNIRNQFEKDYWYEEMVRRGFSSVHHEKELLKIELAVAPVIDPSMIDSLSSIEVREAYRACKSRVVRTEVFARDAIKFGNTEEARKKELTPFSVGTHSCLVELVQPKGKNKHAIFTVREREAITYSYERNSEDPRIAHVLNIRFDAYNNILESANIVYPRLVPDTNLPIEVQQTQNTILVTYTKNEFTNDVMGEHTYRLRLPSETKTFELRGVSKTETYYTANDFADILSMERSNTALYQEINMQPSGNKALKRCIEQIRTVYYQNDLSVALPLHQLESLALPFENYQLAYTPELVTDIFETRVNDISLMEGKYMHSEGDVNWWIRSGTVQYIQNTETQIDAQNRFYTPISYTDPYEAVTKVGYDPSYFLFIERTEDVFGNRASVSQFNYRTLVPNRIHDINNNISETISDELGFIKANAILGKGTEADDLTGFADITNPTELALITDFFQASSSQQLETSGNGLLQHASSRFVYDLEAYMNTGKPVVVATILREEHFAQNPNSAIQINFEYSNGGGEVVMKKVQAEPGIAKAVQVNSDDTILIEEIDTASLSPKELRWIGNGRTVKNNKGAVVKQYEPYFSISHRYEDLKELVETGVTPAFYYDAVGRLIKTEMPDGTFSKVEFDSWKQISYDANDSVLESSWYHNRTNRLIDAQLIADGKDPIKEKEAADKATRHADTPVTLHLDTLGRPVLSVDHTKNRVTSVDEFYHTRIVLDIEGNLRSVIDARNNIVLQHKYTLLGAVAYTSSMDSGQRWLLTTIFQSPLRTWDERNHEFQFFYDLAHRPSYSRVLGGDGLVPLDHIYHRMIYGESLLTGVRTDSDRFNEAVLQATNVLGKVIEQFDTAGLIQTPNYDFKGQPRSTTRKLFRKYKEVANWVDQNLITDLEAGPGYTFSTEIDALARISRQTAPDGSIIAPSYNRTGLLKSESILHQGSTIPNVYIMDIDYNEKGQRTSLTYGNNAYSNFYYDKDTFRLIRLESKRQNGDRLQDWRYTYDPVGNITHIEDQDVPVVFFDNQKITGLSTFTYDPLYRLIEATGRENDATLSFGSCDTWNDQPFKHMLNPGDPMSVRNYAQQYTYDAVGNILEMRHLAQRGNWTRTYIYEAQNNRLIRTQIGSNGSPANYTNYRHHEAHGFQEELPHLEKIDWNFKEEIIQTSRQHCTEDNIPVITYYQYDSNGQRIRKITENQANVGNTPTIKEERVYVSGYEWYKKHTGTHAGLERSSLSLLERGHRFVMIETRNDVDDGTEKQLIRYQLHNHLGSAALELDGTSDANVISYEEYHPFGTTAYQANNAAIKSASKRYRYTGMERDHETGLAYHGARYYVPWLARWTSTDPIGIGDGVNVYRYCQNNPIMKMDKNGKQADDAPIRLRPPSLLDQQSSDDRLVERLSSGLSPGTLRLGPPPQIPLFLPGITIPSTTPESGTPEPDPIENTTAESEESSPSPVQADFSLSDQRLDIRFAERVRLRIGLTSTELSTINTGDLHLQLGYAYGSDLSFRLGDPNIGSASIGFNPSTEVGTMTIAGGTGDSPTDFRSVFSVNTQGNTTLTSSFGFGTTLGGGQTMRFSQSFGFNALTRTFSLGLMLGAPLAPTPTELSTSVPAAESAARSITSSVPDLELSPDGIGQFIDRHNTVPDGSPPGTVSDFSALGTAGGQLGTLFGVPTNPSIRAGFQLSITPTPSTGNPALSITGGIQAFFW